ncbi:unnamed protein product, partial [Mesorhabditis spiculigera]
MFLLILGSLFVIWLIQQFYWKRKDLPPGPTPLPLIGNVLSLVRDPPGYTVLEKWRQQYGPVFTYWFGPYPMIMVADYQLMKDTFVKDGDKYAGRFKNDTLYIFRGGEYGILDTSGDVWREMRRFAIHTFRDFGMGRNIMEEKILCEVGAFNDRLLAQQGQEVSPQWEFDLGVGSVVNNMLLGYRFDEDKHAEFRDLKEVLTDHLKVVSSAPVILAVTVKPLRNLPFFKGAFQKALIVRDRLFEFFDRQIESRKAAIDYDSENNADFVECFLKEIHKRKDEKDGHYHIEQLKNVLFDLWIAGMETTSNTLTWGIAYILNNPEVQKKIIEELDKNIDSDRLITLADKPKLNYISATINEIQRMANLLPINLFHVTTEDVTVAGYTIPNNTMINPLISVLLYDEKVFPEPYKFKPERFLEADGSLKKFEEFMPFSLGKRQCPGEGLAKIELFLFLANVFQKFEVSSVTTPSLKKHLGIIMTCAEYKCKFTERIRP